MARARSDPWRDMARMIECSLCLNTFTDPVSLNNCSHTFCRSCIEILPVAISSVEQGIQCPSCRQFSRQDDYRTNFEMNQFIDIYRNMQNKKKLCGICNTNDAEWTCIECEIDMCQSCRDKHSTDRVTKNHTCQFHGLQNNRTQSPSLFCDSHKDKETVSSAWCIYVR